MNRLAGSSAACRSSTSATGPTGSPRASCRLPSRRGRRASSATSSSPRGSGEREEVPARPDLARIGAIRPSMPTARSTARPSTRPTSCRSSTRRPTRVTFFKMPVRGSEHARIARAPVHASATAKPMQPSAYWGDEKIWRQRANNHNAHVRQERPGVAGGGRARHRQSRVLQAGLGPSFGQGVPARALGAPGRRCSIRRR